MIASTWMGPSNCSRIHSTNQIHGFFILFTSKTTPNDAHNDEDADSDTEHCQSTDHSQLRHEQNFLQLWSDYVIDQSRLFEPNHGKEYPWHVFQDSVEIQRKNVKLSRKSTYNATLHHCL